MKKLFISVIFIALLLCVSFSSFAASLSPGISVLQKSVTMTKNGVAKNTVSFSAEDFEEAIGAEHIGGISITRLPPVEKGVLKIGDIDVVPGEIIPREKISCLRFIPEESGVGADFGFVPCDNGYEDEFICVISMSEELLDTSPTTSSETITDMSGISVYSVLPASDAEGGKLKYDVVSGAGHGTVEITDPDTGAYKYTPDKDYSGKDSFTFCATDEGGNVSNISKITINVLKNGKNFVYSDMEDSSLHLAAAVLAEKDIMLGSKKNGERVFDPCGKVTRADFLIMAMDAAGINVSDGTTEFCDEEDFTPYEKKYISTANALGIIVGVDTEKGRCFLPERNITGGEAALIVCRISAISGYELVGSDISVSVMNDDSYDAVSVLSEAGILDTEKEESELSRADTAKILYSLLSYETDNK
ncbi:MAG: Ig-like domain-containing protein [Eubacteriales bacterium]